MRRVTPKELPGKGLEELRELNKQYEKLVMARIRDDLRLLTEHAAIVTEIINLQTEANPIERQQMIHFSVVLGYISKLLEVFRDTALLVAFDFKKKGGGTCWDFIEGD